jgi:hypothetical protein
MIRRGEREEGTLRTGLFSVTWLPIYRIHVVALDNIRALGATTTIAVMRNMPGRLVRRKAIPGTQRKLGRLYPLIDGEGYYAPLLNPLPPSSAIHLSSSQR